MALPFIVYAEAVLWSRSKETGFTSIIDPQAKMTAQNLKKFYANPAKVKEAVTKLKEKGFSVVFIGKTAVSISGRPQLYESTFGVKLIGTETGKDRQGQPITAVTVQGSTPPTRIDTSTDSTFKNLLAGIVFPLPSTRMQGATPPNKSDPVKQLYPNEIPARQLGWPDNAALRANHTGRGATVFVIDSGCNIDHAYFQEITEEGQVTIEIPDLTRQSLALTKQEHQTSRSLIVESFNKKREQITSTVSDQAERRTQLRELERQRKDLLQQIEGEAEKIEKFLNTNDSDGHGTYMVANVLAVAPKAKIVVIRALFTPISGKIALNTVIDNDDYLQKALTSGVVSCSWGSSESRVFPANPDNDASFIHREPIIRLGAYSPVLFASGNQEHGDQGQNVMTQSYPPQMPEVLAIGGAYRTQGKVSASTHALANINSITTKRVPDVCGWCCNDKEDLLWLPDFEDNESWKLLNGGTSSATAQVAGLCALILQDWPDAPIDIVRALIVLNADDIKTGLFANQTDPRKFSFSTNRIGLVNIERTLQKKTKAFASIQNLGESDEAYQRRQTQANEYLTATIKAWKQRKSEMTTFIKSRNWG